jgi:hypothetical protein
VAVAKRVQTVRWLATRATASPRCAVRLRLASRGRGNPDGTPSSRVACGPMSQAGASTATREAYAYVALTKGTLIESDALGQGGTARR